MRMVSPVLMVGLVLLAAAGGMAWQTAAFLSRATIVQGIVDDDAPHPAIRFRTGDGTALRFVQNGFVSRPRGSRIRVAYDAARPLATATAASFWPLWGRTVWAGVPGALLVVLALAGATLRLPGAG